MPLNPNLSLGVQVPQSNGPAQMLDMQGAMRRNQLAELELTEAKKGVAGRNELAKLYGNPANMDAAGMPKPDVMQNFISQYPTTGLEARNQMLAEQERRGHIAQSAAATKSSEELARERARARAVETVSPKMLSVLTSYDEQLNKGVPIAEAAKQAQLSWQEQVEELEKGGELDQATLGKLKTSKFNPYVFRFQLTHSGQGGAAGTQPRMEDRYEKVGKKWMKYQIKVDPLTGRETRVAGTDHPQFKPNEGGSGAAGVLTDATADLHGDEFLAKLSPLDRNTVKGLVNYDTDPKTIPGGMVMVDGQKRSRREYMLSLARQVDPEYSETAYREKTIALGEFQRTKGNAVRFLNVSIDHIDTAAEYAKALKNGDIPAINKLKNWWEQNTGKTAPNTFNGIKDIVASEVIKGAIGGPGGVEERRENAEKVKAANSPEQLSELFTGWKKLMAGQMKGLEKAYESGTRLKNFRQKYMLPRSRKALEEVSDDGEDDKPKGEKPKGEKPAGKKEGPAPTNSKGWNLMRDAKGNMAYVSPDRKQFEEVK